MVVTLPPPTLEEEVALCTGSGLADVVALAPVADGVILPACDVEGPSLPPFPPGFGVVGVVGGGSDPSSCLIIAGGLEVGPLKEAWGPPGAAGPGPAFCGILGP